MFIYFHPHKVKFRLTSKEIAEQIKLGNNPEKIYDVIAMDVKSKTYKDTEISKKELTKKGSVAGNVEFDPDDEDEDEETTTELTVTKIWLCIIKDGNYVWHTDEDLEPIAP